jgi:hypothetical protein
MSGQSLNSGYGNQMGGGAFNSAFGQFGHSQPIGGPGPANPNLGMWRPPGQSAYGPNPGLGNWQPPAQPAYPPPGSMFQNQPPRMMPAQSLGGDNGMGGSLQGFSSQPQPNNPGGPMVGGLNQMPQQQYSQFNPAMRGMPTRVGY